jgi:hypothetical protein
MAVRSCDRFRTCSDPLPLQIAPRERMELQAYLTELDKSSSAISTEWSGVDHFRTGP